VIREFIRCARGTRPTWSKSVRTAPRYEPSNGRYAFYGERWAKDPNKPNPLGDATANPLLPSQGQ